MLDFLEKNKDITQYSNFKTQAKAKYFYEITHLDQLQKLKEIFEYIRENNIDHLIISGGTNMLFAFEEFNGIVIKNSLYGWSYSPENKILESYSAENIWNIAEVLETDDNQNLWHRFIGLPGSVAGAVFGNAGCFGLETQNNFTEAFVLDKVNGETKFLSAEDMQFEYRSSILKTSEKYFLIKAKFNLSEKKEKYASDIDNIYFREHKQPKGNTCGSFFKNPSREFSAGKLIEDVGLKGYKIGGAYFSELHANFLMHDGQGNYQDLLDLIELAQKKVFQKFNIHLENEVRIITNK